MKIEVILKPCPWCRCTPELVMPIEDPTWLWYIECRNPQCKARPRAPYTAFRNSAKNEFYTFAAKLQELVSKWNDNNFLAPYEMKVIDLRKIIQDDADWFNKYTPQDEVWRIE